MKELFEPTFCTLYVVSDVPLSIPSYRWREFFSPLPTLPLDFQLTATSIRSEKGQCLPLLRFWPQGDAHLLGLESRHQRGLNRAGAELQWSRAPGEFRNALSFLISGSGTSELHHETSMHSL